LDASSKKITGVTCKSVPVTYEKISDTVISIVITKEYSGKFIIVKVEDSTLPTTTTFSTVPAYIMPRHSEITGRCLACPTGKFSGSYGASDISACKDTENNQISSRRLLSIDETLLTSSSAIAYIQIQNEIIIVLGIKEDLLNEESDFSFEVCLKSSITKIIQDNIAMVAIKILETYNVNNRALTKKTSPIRLHSSNLAVIFRIYGDYTNTTNKVFVKKDSDSLLFGMDTLTFILLMLGAGVFYW